MSEVHRAFELELHVSPEDVDDLGHVNNIVYLRWVQQVATAHWRSLAPAVDQDRIAWVVLRHEIDYKQPALPDDALVARTWVGSANRLSFERHTEILRANSRNLLARSRTVWCPVDRRTGKPTRVNAALVALFSVSTNATGGVPA